MVIDENFEIHSKLNEKLWDTNTELLLPDVRQQIIKIVTEFENHLRLPLEILDIQLVGSNASYNYTEDSDLDVHVIANYEALNVDTDFVQAFYDLEKSKFNKDYDISIHGIEIEIYVQDVKSTVISNGIYSLCDNKWIKQPVKITDIVLPDVSTEFEKWKNKIQQSLQISDRKELQRLVDLLYLIRHNSIASDGEYGKGNQIFKAIRNSGLLQQLKDELRDSTSRELTLEGCEMESLLKNLEN